MRASNNISLDLKVDDSKESNSENSENSNVQNPVESIEFNFTQKKETATARKRARDAPELAQALHLFPRNARCFPPG